MYGIKEEDRQLYVRLDSAKVNLLRRGGKATWFKLLGVPLNNGTPEYPNGDEIQTVEPWTPPDTFDGLADASLNAALTEIDAGLPNGQRYSNSGPARGRAAWPIVQKHCPNKTEAQCRQIINTWVRTGLLCNKTYDDPIERKERNGLHVNDAGRSITVSEDKITTTIVPAAPGWYMGQLPSIAETSGLDYRPIIAWEIERDQEPRYPKSGRQAQKTCFRPFPICAYGLTIRWENDTYALRSPDGNYWSADGVWRLARQRATGTIFLASACLFFF